jgi:hypothetical protein
MLGVAESVQPGCALEVSNLRRGVSEPQLVGMSGAAAYPGGIESSEVAPCGVTVVMEKMLAWASGT